MDDLISREAAIGRAVEIPLFGKLVKVVAVSELEALPSAQPEIIRCRDCKHYNAGFECLIEGYGIERSADWYCADAERRTDDKTNKGSSC